MDGPGTISWDEFLENAESFVVVSNEISDSWEIRGDKSIPGQAYLYRQVRIFVPSNYITDDSQFDEDDRKSEDDDGNNENCYIDDPYVGNCDNERPFVTEHHILWSMSYGVPVLYFNAWLSDFPGVNRISVATAQKLVRQDNLGYGELSQGIHPILGTTMLQLHPCKAHELLSNTRNSSNKLVSWLSAVSPAALNLKISLKYFELTRSQKKSSDANG